jgi:predicted DCC family thiol-disulfide oxidoreductase YuxK
VWGGGHSCSRLACRVQLNIHSVLVCCDRKQRLQLAGVQAEVSQTQCAWTGKQHAHTEVPQDPTEWSLNDAALRELQ